MRIAVFSDIHGNLQALKSTLEQIDKFYDAMEKGRSYDEVVDKAVDVVTNGITQRPDFDINSLSDY